MAKKDLSHDRLSVVEHTPKGLRARYTVACYVSNAQALAEMHRDLIVARTGNTVDIVPITNQPV